jgi:hypothetical protein
MSPPALRIGQNRGHRGRPYPISIEAEVEMGAEVEMEAEVEMGAEAATD